MNEFRPQLLIIAVLFAVSLITGSAIAAATHTSPATKNGKSVGASGSNTLAANFAILRHEPVHPNGLIDAQVELMTRTMGLDVEKAQPIANVNTKADLWVAPTADGVCLLNLPPGTFGPGAACSHSGDSLGGQRMSYTIYSDRDIDAAGLVHDGVSSVSLTLKNGSTLDLPVRQNVWSAHVSSEPAQVQFKDPDGTTVTDSSK